MKKRRSADFCADQIDVITDFAVITNVVIKRVNCIILIYFTEKCPLSYAKSVDPDQTDQGLRCLLLSYA